MENVLITKNRDYFKKLSNLWKFIYKTIFSPYMRMLKINFVKRLTVKCQYPKYGK